MVARFVRSAPWITFAGVIALLAGLAWDAALHSLDPELAAREGVLSASNPGHVLFGGGIAVIVVGVALLLLGRLDLRGLSRRRLAAVVAPVAGLMALMGVAFALALSAGSLGGPEHVHDDGTVHTHSQHEEFLAEQTADGPASAASSGLRGVTHDHGEGVMITAPELEAATRLVGETRAGVARLQDITVARAEGYVQITPGRSGLAHYHNQKYYTDGLVLDPEHPEQLIYFRMPNGEMKLVGVMYLQAPGEAGPKVGGALTAWHAHDNLCFSPTTGAVVGLTDASGRCAPGSVFRGKTGEMLHVWLVDNPKGVFSDDMSPAVLLDLLAKGGSN